MSTLTLLSGYLSKYASLSMVPAQYQWLIPIALVIFGLSMLFYSARTWKVTVAAVGAASGYLGMQYYATPYLNSVLPVSGNDYVVHLLSYTFTIPMWYIPVIVAGITAVILWIAIRFAISGAIGYGAFLGASHYLILSKSILIGVIVFVLAFFLYRKITVIISKVIGIFAIFFGLVIFGVPSEYAAIVSAILFIVAWILVFYRSGALKSITGIGGKKRGEKSMGFKNLISKVKPKFKKAVSEEEKKITGATRVDAEGNVHKE